VRVLGIDTSSQRGSVALVDGAAVVCALHHERPNAHAEELLPLVTRAFAEAGFEKSSIDKIAAELGSDLARYIHPDADLPHARSVALLGVALEPDLAPPAPQYVRDSGATKQDLPVFQPGQG
jgi:tRNA A37 threonylcarbamoyltransferase TsaD